MFQLIYASTAARRLKESDLHELVERARGKNKRLGVTGMLVYRNGSFLQILEGKEEAVRTLYRTIGEDDRHRWVTLLKAVTVEKRDFADRPLAFHNRSMAGGRLPKAAGEAEGAGTKHETLVQFERVSMSASDSRSAPSGEEPPTSPADAPPRDAAGSHANEIAAS